MVTLDVRFVLRHPETFDWRHDEGFDAAVQARLLRAHQSIIPPLPSPVRAATIEVGLLKLSLQPMSRRQRMLLFYLLAQCGRARDLTVSVHFVRCLEWCTRAEEIAGALVDLGAQVDLHELRGTLHRAISIYWLAAEEFSLALRFLREHAGDGESLDPEFEVTLASKTAAVDYLLGNMPRALDHLRRAQSLLPLTNASPLSRGTMAWTFALIHRQCNDLAEASKWAQEAVALYLDLAPTNSTGRLLTLAADIAMDIAEAPEGQSEEARQDGIAKAADLIDTAFHVGREVDDGTGICLAELSLARLVRLTGSGTANATQARIRSVMRQARAPRDDSLLAAAQTALGFDLLACDDRMHARTWFNKAIRTAVNIGAPGLGFLAQRGLGRAADDD